MPSNPKALPIQERVARIDFVVGTFVAAVLGVVLYTWIALDLYLSGGIGLAVFCLCNARLVSRSGRRAFEVVRHTTNIFLRRAP